MHEDQIRDLLRTLETDRDPDSAFADALYGRLALAARTSRRSRAPFLLAAAVLLALLAASVTIGSGLVRLPIVVDASPQPTASVDATSTPAEPTPSATDDGVAPPTSPSPTSGPIPPEAVSSVVMVTADGLAIRAEASTSAAVLARVNAGQTAGIVGGPVEADGLSWYEVRIGPGPLGGWVTSGPDRAWLRLVTDGVVGFVCEAGCDEDGLVSATPFGDARITLITSEHFRDWTWSPDGTRIAATFDGGNAGEAEIVVMASDGSGRRVLGPGYGPAWSPDGSRLAWSTGTTLVVTDEALAPRELDLDLRNAGNPMWAPDGSALAFGAIVCDDCPDGPIQGDPPTATWIVGVDGTGLQQLTEGGYSVLVDWSPDGTTLAFVQYDLSGEFPTRAYLLPAAGGERTYLAGGEAIDAAPSWSPDGRFLLYSASLGIVVAAGDGSDPHMPAGVFEEGHGGSLAWSPSGRWILLENSVSVGPDMGATSLVIAPADGSAPPRAISPTGARLFFGGGWLSGGWQPLLEPLP